MKILDIVHNDISVSYPEIHSTRLATLFTFVSSGMKDQRVSVTYLGRGLKSLSKTTVKNDIKRADRLIGNVHLHSERVCFYTHMAEKLIGDEQHPIVLIDWSPIEGQAMLQVLRASIPMGGRALTLYERVHPESEINTQKAHQSFLDALALILPEGCQPIIVTDAIYRAPWFNAVEQKSWYWIGRVRGRVCLSRDGEQWQSAYQWFKQAKQGKSDYLGSVLYGKTAKFGCHAVLYKRKAKRRKAKKKRGGVSQRTTDKIHEKEAREPWLLVFKLPDKYMNKTKTAVKLYTQRMQIEENFRDTKNNKLGIGLEVVNSKCAKRFENLLLIAALMLFLLWCIGYTAVLKGMQYSLQANTIRHRAVLSVISVAREIIDDERYRIPEEECIYSFMFLHEFVITINKLDF